MRDISIGECVTLNRDTHHADLFLRLSWLFRDKSPVDVSEFCGIPLDEAIEFMSYLVAMSAAPVPVPGLVYHFDDDDAVAVSVHIATDSEWTVESITQGEVLRILSRAVDDFAHLLDLPAPAVLKSES